LNQGDFNSPKYSNNYPDSKSNSNLIEIKSLITKNKINETKLSLETAIKFVPAFNGVNGVDSTDVDFAIKPVLLQAIRTKLSGIAFEITQHREIKYWKGLKFLLESNFCAIRTPGYLQLELTSYIIIR